MASTLSTRPRVFVPLVVIAGLLAIAVLGGLQRSPAAPSPSLAVAEVNAQPDEFSPRVMAVRPKGYHSLRELAADADAIVVARATSIRSVERIENIPFSVTEMETVQAWQGSLATGARFKLRQLGDTGIRGEVPVVSANQLYVVFLMRFTFGPGRETDQFVPVGVGAGLFSVVGSQAHRIDQLSPDLPLRIELAQIQAEVRPPTR